MAFVDCGYKVLKVMADVTDRYRRAEIMTCVSLAKSVLGVHDFTVLTPYQLYNALIKRGAEILHE